MAGTVYQKEPTIEDFDYLEEADAQQKYAQAQEEYSQTGSYTVQDTTAGTTTAPTTDATETHTYEQSQDTPHTQTDATDDSYTSLESQAESLMQAGYDEDVATEEELGLPEGTAYTSLEEMVEDYLSTQTQTLASAEQSAAASGVSAAVNLAELKKQAESGAAAVEAEKATSREGAVSTTAGMISADYTSRMRNMVTAAEANFNATRTEQALALDNLKSAIRDQNQSLIDQYQQEYDMAYLEAQQAQTDYMNAYSSYSEENRLQQAQTAANLETFQGLVADGTEMSVSAVQGFADQLGIDFQTAYEYYEGAQAIRDDKTLDTATKATELEALNFDLQDAMLGNALSQQSKLDYYLSEIQSGKYSGAEIQSLAQLLEIPDENNPVYQAELKLSQAEAQIKEDVANGVISNPADYIDYLTALGEYNATMGTADYYMPTTTSTIYDTDGNEITASVMPTAGGIMVNVEDGTVLQRGECGEFVNDVLGTSFPDDKGVKLSMADRNLAPAAGMVAVFDVGDWGHVAIVESVDLVNQTMTIVESNWGEKNYHTVGTRENIPITEAYGFMTPENSTKITSQGGVDNTAQALAESIMDPLSNMTYSDLTDTQKAEVEPLLNQMKAEAAASGDIYGVMAASAGGKSATESFRTSFEKAATVINQLSLLSTYMNSETAGTDEFGNAIDMSPLSGWLAEKNPWDTDAQSIKAILQGTVPNLARGIFGEVGVLTDHDIELYMQTLPNLRQTDDVKQAVLGLTLRTVQAALENKISINAGTGVDMSGVSAIYKELDDQIKDIESGLGISETDAIDTDAIADKYDPALNSYYDKYLNTSSNQ